MRHVAAAAIALLAVGLAVIACAAADARAADAVRSFDGSDDIWLRTTSASNISGAVSIAALIRPGTTDVAELLVLHDASGSPTGYELLQDSNGRLTLSNRSGISITPTIGTVTRGDWQLVVVTKANGTATPRFHVYRFATATWTHVNGNNSMGNAGDTSGGTTRIGSYWGVRASRYRGDMAAAAIFPTALTDLQVESLAGDYQDWAGLDPGGMWILNQVDDSHPVLDETDRSADELWETSSPAVTANASPLGGDPDSTIFRGDFATGDTEQWWYTQEVGSTASVAVASSSPAPPAGESHYGRFELRRGDERAELMTGLELAEGEDVYIRFLAQLDSGFPVETGVWGQLIWQLHQAGVSGSPPIELGITTSGNWVLDSPSGAWWRGPAIDTGTWHEFVVRVKHSPDAAVGYVELWMDGVQQTLANGRQRQYGRTLLDLHNYPKTGYYRDSAMVGTGVVRIAGYRIARGFADAGR